MWKARTRFETMHEIQNPEQNNVSKMQIGLPLRTSMRMEKPEPNMGRKHHPNPPGQRRLSQDNLATRTHKTMATKRRIQAIRQRGRDTTSDAKRKGNVQRNVQRT